MTHPTFELTPAEIESLVRKIQKVHDGYAKMNAMNSFVEWSERGPLLWHLVRQGLYPAWDDPAIWPELVQAAEHASSEDVAAFLTRVTSYDSTSSQEQTEADSDFDGYGDEYYEDEYYGDEYYDDYDGGYDDGYESAPSYQSQRLVSYWPSILDELVFPRYAEDPAPFEARFDECTEPVQKGLALIQYRLGQRPRPPENTLEDLAATYVESGLPWQVWALVDEAPQYLVLHDTARRDHFTAFVTLFGTEDQWARHVLDRLLAAEYMPGFDRTYEVWAIATREELVRLLEGVSAYGKDAATVVNFLLEREETAADFAELASVLAERNRAGSAEILAMACLLRCARRKGEHAQDVPEGVEAHLQFDLPGNPSHRCGYAAMEMFREALHALPLDRLTARMLELFEGEYTKAKPFPAVHVALARGAAILDETFEAAEAHVARYPAFSSANPIVSGLALLGLRGVPALEARERKAADHEALRQVYHRAILGALADAKDFDACYDRYVSFVAWQDENTRESELEYYVFNDVNTALQHLDDARATAVFERELAHEGPGWARVFAGLACRPLAEPLARALERVASEGLPELDVDYFGTLLREAGEAVLPRLGDVLAKSSSTVLHNAVKGHLGEARYQELVAAAGGTAAADRGPADKIWRLSQALLKSRPDAPRTTITVFERLEEPAPPTAINRLRGRPFGVTRETWPCMNGDADIPMEHLFTIDLALAPRLQEAAGSGVRAIALYVASPDYNEAWTPGNAWTEVQFLTEDDIARGPYEGELPAGSEEATAFQAIEIEVPLEAFVVSYGSDPELEKVRNAIYTANAWSGPAPMWLQSEEHFGVFLLQFDEGFSYMNLGDMGIMYVFADTAFWQCH